MADLPSSLPDARKLLGTARRDRRGAAEAMGKLPLPSQVALVCEAPLSLRGAVLDLAPEPEKLIPLLPEAELCFAIKAVGLADSAWILEHATPEQVVACLDLDVWRGALPDRAGLGSWLDLLADTGDTAFLRSVRALDPELIVLFLKSRLGVVMKPSESDGWDPPDGSQTLEGQFHYYALDPEDDLATVHRLLHMLFEHDYWTYFRMMQGVIWELESDNEEWSLRWRTGRLEDLGFPPWDHAMRIYRTIDPKQRAAVPNQGDALDVAGWRLPVWIPQLPAGADARHGIFQALARLGDEERGAAFFAFVAVVNQVAVADRMPLGDAESTPRAIEKTARLMSGGLDFVARENDLDLLDVLRRVPMERLFSVGANLDPESARPPGPVLPDTEPADLE
jgi:hypothetical protein